MAIGTGGCMLAGKRPLPLLWIADNWGSLLSTSALFANIFCVALHVYTVRAGKAVRMSGNVIYDFFMGAALNPRIADIDLKMLAEIRVSWITLFMLTCGAASKQIERDGHISGPMLTLVIAHFLYSNACMKGEACVPTTFDIFYEKDGWMLIFWNLTGVPFVYTWNSFYALYHYAGEKRDTFAWPYYASLIAVLLAAYYVWDASQSQRNHFRMWWNKSGESGIERPWAFPKLPWRTLNNPKWIDTEKGKPLLISGFCGMARKIHYTMDIIMALIWGLACGFDSPLPYYYVVFFTSFIAFRAGRDRKRCAKQYGKDWEQYEKEVPYVWFPGLI
jgi:delta24(24(1))-sterol reductase